MCSPLLLILATVCCSPFVNSLRSAQSEELAKGEWSKPVVGGDGYAIRGRLVLCEKVIGENRREVAVYVELQDASDFIASGGIQVYCDFGKTDFRPEYKSGLRCELHDKENKLIEPVGYPFGGSVPLSEFVKIPADATVRLRASPFGIHREKALAISPELNKLWTIADGDPGEYFLSGTFTVAPSSDQIPNGDGHVWRGVIDLPPVQIVSRRQ